MRIAHLAPYSLTFPLKNHNGRYTWMLQIARAQIAAGHDVVIFAGPGSHDDSAIQWRTLDKTPGLSNLENNRALIETAFLDPSIDIFHSHFDALPYTLAHRTSRPVVTTQHWFPTSAIGDVMRAAPSHENFIAVPVTQLMAKTDDKFGIRRSDVIYHGIDLEKFTPEFSKKSDRFLFVGRITPQKGVKEAIELALQANIKLDLIGKLKEKDEAYWKEIDALVDGETIRYLGPKSPTEVATAMQHARAMLFPIQQPEAFGLVTVEAQACGTPVIISEVGASSELVRHQKTGFVCASPTAFIDAIEKIDMIDPHLCRQNAEKFNIQTMFKKYDELYIKLAK